MLPTARAPSTSAGQNAMSTGRNRSRSARITSSLASESRPAITPTRRGKAGSALPPRGVGEPVGLQLAQHLGLAAQQLALAGRPDPVGGELQPALLRPEVGVREVDLDQLARARMLVGRRHLLLPDPAVEHGALVGQREVRVAARRDVPALHLALDPAAALGAQRAANPVGDLPDRLAMPASMYAPALAVPTVTNP